MWQLRTIAPIVKGRLVSLPFHTNSFLVESHTRKETALSWAGQAAQLCKENVQRDLLCGLSVDIFKGY